MRLTAINCIILACAAIAMASKPRSKRHLHKIKEIITDHIFGSSEPNSTESLVSEPETKYFKIPGFDNVVIKAVPKSSTIEPLPIIEKIPANSQIGIIGSYLGTDNLNDTYNALLGVKNLMTSGILNTNTVAIEDLLSPTKEKYIVHRKPVKPCARPEFIGAPAIQPVRVVVKPPRAPAVLPTQYSYKQVNRDGSLTSYTSSLDLSNGVKVIEEGKTLPFFIDRVRKIPVRLPVPVLPEVSKIVAAPIDVSYGPYPMEFVTSGSSYSYRQIHHDDKLTTYSDLPPLYANHNGPVVFTETGKIIPPPPVFIMDRIEKVAATASYPKVPFIDFIETKPMAIDVPSGHEVYSAPVLSGPVPLPPPSGYAYTQFYGNGIAADFYGSTPQVTVTKKKLDPLPITPFPRPPMTPEPVILESQPVPVFQSMSPATNSFFETQGGNGKETTYTGSGIAEENPAAIAKSARHPIPPPYLTDRIEKVAAGAWFNRPPLVSSPIVRPFAYPVPIGAVHIPSVHPSVPKRPVKIPTTSGTSQFLYKHVHKDGSMTSFGGDSSINTKEKTQAQVPMPSSPQRVFESPIHTGPFPMNVNPNAIKPSTPVSESYSYKLVSNNQLINEQVRSAQGPYHVPPEIIENNMPVPVPPEAPMVQTPVQSFGPYDDTVPLSYTYKQISHSKPDSFIVVNVEDPVRGATKVNPNFTQIDRNTNGYVYVPPAVVDTPIPQAPQVPGEVPRSSFSYKQVTNQGLYEYNDEFGSGVRTNQPPIMKPEEIPEVVHVERVTLRPQRNPVLKNRNSLRNNPIVVPESDPVAAPVQTFSFKQSNSDGSSITTVKDGQNSLSVKVEEASKPESMTEEAKRINSNTEQVSQAATLVPVPVDEATTTAPVPRKKLRRRIIKRVKNRGDIPEVE